MNRRDTRFLGFTLVELLVVMSILGVLMTLVSGGFRSAQLRGRDAQRKSDLKELSNSLEIFYADYGRYPPDTNGFIAGCSYIPATQTGNSCTWGNANLSDGKTTYFKLLPKDPQGKYSYFYRIVPSSNNQKYQLFARLENTKDIDCLNEDCLNPPISILCGTQTCNFAVTSANTSALE